MAVGPGERRFEQSVVTDVDLPTGRHGNGHQLLRVEGADSELPRRSNNREQHRCRPAARFKGGRRGGLGEGCGWSGRVGGEVVTIRGRLR